MDNNIHTLKTFAKEMNVKENTAMNMLSRLKKEGKVTVNGGGKQKRIYTISKIPLKRDNGFYQLVNKYSPEKLAPKFIHSVHGRYTIERAIIEGILIGDVRTLTATSHLFKHVKNWKRLFNLAKKYKVTTKTHKLYQQAKKNFKCKTMPKRYNK